MTEKWESEEGTKFGILHPVLARLTQMGFTVKQWPANLPLLLWMLPCGALESVFASEIVLTPKNSYFWISDSAALVWDQRNFRMYQNEINDLEITLRIVILC